ncbi:MAG: putative lipid II flippase FtsW [Sciscionella sp.]
MTTAARTGRRTGRRERPGSGNDGGVLGSRVTVVRTALTAWLGRPLASFHLILAVFGLLTVLGLVMVLSATSVESYSQDSSVYGLFKKQALFVALGTVLFWLGLRLPLKLFRRFSGAFVALCVLMLVAVLLIGPTINGSKGWFQIGPLSFQPVEVAKLALTLWGAHVLVCKQAVLHQYRHLLVPVIPVALLMFALVMLQPDLGSTVTLGAVVVALLWFVGAPLRIFAALLGGGIAGVLMLAIGAKYRLARVISFLNPGADTQGGSYQAHQALYALADGGLFGQGLGQGASKWRYLPNLRTDFIFALVGEELGLIGALVVVGLFVALAVVGLRIAARNVDPWIKLIAGTLTVWLVTQASINIGYVVGLLPVTGVTLPMISYGGTSITATMLVFGILANCARHEPAAVADLRSQGPGRFGRLLRLPAPPVYQPPVRRKPARPSPPPRGAGRPGGSKGRSPTGQDRRRQPRAAPAADYRRRASGGRVAQ